MTPTYTLHPMVLDMTAEQQAKVAADALWYASATTETDAEVHAARYAFVQRVRQVTDPDSWLLSFTVCPGDWTNYRVTVGYDRLRHDAPWLIGLEPSGCTWVNVPVYDGTAEAPHVGYVASHWPSVNPVPGVFVALTFATEVLARRAEALHEHDAQRQALISLMTKGAGR